MGPSEKLTVLCVDDEPQVVSGLCLHLRRRYQPLTASSGAAALDLLRHHPETAVVISDLRMPVMDGAMFLELARRVAPDAVRILLTGHADTDAAIAAVNHGQIFRFLTKPCSPPTLIAAIDAAAGHHRFLTSERVLLEQTLRGSLEAVTNTLSLTSPLAFGCITRVRQLVSTLAAQLGWPHSWQTDVAAMLCRLGSASLPAATMERLHQGKQLSEDEAQMVRRIPALTQELLANIPRLESVRAILAGCVQPYDARATKATTANPPVDVAQRGAELLKAALDFEALDSRGMTPRQAILEMRNRQGHYDPAVLDALQTIRAGNMPLPASKDIPLSALTVGMVLDEDLRSSEGALLCARGSRMSAPFLERIRNAGIANAHVRVIADRHGLAPEAS